MSPKNILPLDDESGAALARCLKQLRLAASPQLNQKEAASKLGVSPSTLSEIEHGNQEPTLQLIRNAAQLYKVHPNTILGVIYMQEFYMKEFDPEGYMLGEAAGAVRLQDALTPEQRQEAREKLEKLGYQKLP